MAACPSNIPSTRKVRVALTVAVLAHDIADGVNTVNLSLSGRHDRRVARRWLAADAAAPLLGIAASRLIVSVGVLKTFAILGIAYLIAVVVPAFWMRNPPANYQPAGWQPSAGTRKERCTTDHYGR